MKYDLDYYNKKLKEKYNNEYSILTTSEEYKTLNSHSKIKFKHNTCNTIFYKSLHGLLRDEKCPLCSKTKRKSIQYYQMYLDNKFGKDIYEILSTEYINSYNKIKIKHLKCNYEWDITPNLICDLKSCPNCKKNNLINYANNKRNSYEYIKNYIENFKDYKLISKNYKNNKDKIKIKHLKCNKIYITKFNTFQNGCRCPYCNQSKGETKIENWLIKNNYEYEKQYTFKDCKNIKELPFDFKLENDSDNKIILIEYDGVQHFEKAWFDTEDDFINRQKRDEIKNKYCKQHCNIDLYRIKYTDFNNIENILETIIKHYE